MPNIHPTFAVPFGFAKRESDDNLNQQLSELFLTREKQGDRFANPSPYTLRNPELFESNFDLFKWPEPCVTRLKEFCWSEMMRMIADLNGYDEAFLKRIRIGADAWFHVTRRGGFFGLHNHPMASWSGVYCVSAGEQDEEQPQSGLLTFVNPFVMNTMFVDAGTAQMRAPFSNTSRSYRLEAGQLVLFPSWVLHEVKPFHGEAERITVAFNAWFHLT